MSLYNVPHQKSSKKDEQGVGSHIVVTSQKSVVNDGRIVGEAVNKARSFAHMPANILTTSQFVDDIKALFKGFSISGYCTE